MHFAPLVHRLFCLALLLAVAGLPARQAAAAAQADAARSPRVIETAGEQGTLAGLARRYPAIAAARKDFAAAAKARGSPVFRPQDRAGLPPGSAWPKVVRGSAQDAALAADETIAGTARAGQDVVPVKGVLQFALGQTVGWIGVPLVGDGAAEPRERSTVRLSRPPSGSTIDAGITSVFIRDHDRGAATTAAAEQTKGNRAPEPSG